MSKPILVSLSVCIASLMIAIGIIKATPYCDGDSECTFELAPYTLGSLSFGFVSALFALFLCWYGITVGLMRLEEYLRKNSN